MARSNLSLRQGIDFNLQGFTLHGNDMRWKGGSEPLGSIAYLVGDVVAHAGMLWIAVANNDNSEPSATSTDWTALSAADTPDAVTSAVLTRITTQEQWDQYVTDNNIQVPTSAPYTLPADSIPDGSIFKFTSAGTGEFNPIVVPRGTGDPDTYTMPPVSLPLAAGQPAVGPINIGDGDIFPAAISGPTSELNGDYAIRFRDVNGNRLTTARTNEAFGTTLNEGTAFLPGDTATGIFINFANVAAPTDISQFRDPVPSEIRGLPLTTNGQLVRLRREDGIGGTNAASGDFVFIRATVGAADPPSNVLLLPQNAATAVEWDSTSTPADAATAGRFVAL